MSTILHLGLGRFHRGHQVVYYQKAGNWKVVSSTMRTNDERDKLKAVKLRYPVLELSHESETLTWIDCIHEALSLKDDLQRLLEVFRSPETTIVTLTVTEKGYCLLPSGELDLAHEGIRHDLGNPTHPSTAIGFLALGLKERKSPLTIISCDNLRENGHKLERALKKFMGELPSNVTFPNTMVDRIVPALLPVKIAELEKKHGLHHSELIATEKFSQWVIEDKFAGPRPDWDKVGVEFVKDVRPYEEMKLRLLNASHSYLAYAGLNRGHTFVHEAIRDNELRNNVLTLMKKEVVPLLTVPQGFDVMKYIDNLITRFQNDRLPHQLKQIAMDGSQKLPQRIFSSLEAKGKEQTVLRKCVKEWLEFLWNNRDGKIDDPKANELLEGKEQGKDVWFKAQIARVLPG
jgi:fructuronate reductase